MKILTASLPVLLPAYLNAELSNIELNKRSLVAVSGFMP